MLTYKQTKIVEKLVALVILLSLIWLALNLITCNDIVTEKPYWEEKGFKPDTVYIPKPFTLADSLKFRVPPRIILIYSDTSKNNYHTRCPSDSLVDIIDSLGKVVNEVTSKYLTFYTTSNKLIDSHFKLDTLSLSLLQTNGIIKTEIYPVDYTHYNYQYQNNQFRAEPIKINTKPSVAIPKLNQNVYASGGYKLLTRAPSISLDYYLRYNKFQVNLEPLLTIEKNPTLEINGKIGYKIK